MKVGVLNARGLWYPETPISNGEDQRLDAILLTALLIKPWRERKERRANDRSVFQSLTVYQAKLNWGEEEGKAKEKWVDLESGTHWACCQQSGWLKKTSHFVWCCWAESGPMVTLGHSEIYGLVHFCSSVGFKEYDTHSDPEEMQTNVKNEWIQGLTLLFHKYYYHHYAIFITKKWLDHGTYSYFYSPFIIKHYVLI